MDCLHREFGEGVCSPYRATQRTRIAGVQPPVPTSATAAMSEKVDRFGPSPDRPGCSCSCEHRVFLDDAARHLDGSAANIDRLGNRSNRRPSCSTANAAHYLRERRPHSRDEPEGALGHAPEEGKKTGITSNGAATIVTTIEVTHVVTHSTTSIRASPR